MRVQMKCVKMQYQNKVCNLKVKMLSTKKPYNLVHFCQWKFKGVNLKGCVFKLLKTEILLYHQSCCVMLICSFLVREERAERGTERKYGEMRPRCNHVATHTCFGEVAGGGGAVNAASGGSRGTSGQRKGALLGSKQKWRRSAG